MPAPADEADLPPFSNLRAVCARCARRMRAYMIFDRDCGRARGDHYHRRCTVCGHEWLIARGSRCDRCCDQAKNLNTGAVFSGPR
jgi:formate dehydrogenase maturation protein FdhE